MLQQISTVARKELRLLLQKPGQLILIFIVPFLFIWIMGATFGGQGVPTVAIYVVNEDQGDRGEEVRDALEDAKNLEVEMIESREEADRLVNSGRRMAAVVIPPDFSAALLTDQGAVVEVIVDPARDEQARIVLGLAGAHLAEFIVDAEVTRGVQIGMADAMTDFDFNEADEETQFSLMDFMTAGMKGVVAKQVKETLNDPIVKVKVQPNSGNQTRRSPNAMQVFVPGYSLMFVFFLVTNLAGTVVEERDIGALRRLLATPAPRIAIVLGKVLPYFLIALVQFTVLFGVSTVIFELELGNNLTALALVAIATAAVVAGLGIMIASLAKTEGQAGNMTTLLIISMAAVSGTLSNTITVPGLNYLTPHYWALTGFQNVMARDLGFAGIVLPCAVLMGFAVIFFAVGINRFQFE